MAHIVVVPPGRQLADPRPELDVQARGIGRAIASSWALLSADSGTFRRSFTTFCASSTAASRSSSSSGAARLRVEDPSLPVLGPEVEPRRLALSAMFLPRSAAAE